MLHIVPILCLIFFIGFIEIRLKNELTEIEDSIRRLKKRIVILESDVRKLRDDSNKEVRS